MIELRRKVAKSGAATLFLEFDKKTPQPANSMNVTVLRRLGNEKTITNIETNDLTLLFSDWRQI